MHVFRRGALRAHGRAGVRPKRIPRARHWFHLASILKYLPCEEYNAVPIMRLILNTLKFPEVNNKLTRVPEES